MAISEINKIAVIGAGVMGHGIAQLFAVFGHQVNLLDINEKLLKEALDKIGWSLNKFVDKQMISQDQSEKALASIKTFTNLAGGLKDVDFVLETVTEDLELKHKVYREICKFLPEDIIIASNTSDIRITRLAEAVTSPSRFVGMHFVNPAPLMPFVGIVLGEETREETGETTRKLAEGLGKMTLVLKKDRDLADVLGWIYFESLWRIEDGDYTQEEIDASFRAEGFPMGIIELLDFIGLDTVLHVLKQKDMKAPPVLEEKVQNKKLGKKTIEGFYDWSKGRPPIPMEKAHGYDVLYSMAPAVNEAALFIEEGVCSGEELDMAFEKGQSFPYGPLKYADMRGIDAVVEALQSSPRKYNPHPRLLKMVKEGQLGQKSGKGFYEYGS